MTTQTQTTAKPTHRIYLVQDAGKDKKPLWTEIGAVWPHKDGQGGSLSFKATPMELLTGKGRIVYRTIKDSPADKQAAPQ